MRARLLLFLLLSLASAAGAAPLVQAPPSDQPIVSVALILTDQDHAADAAALAQALSKVQAMTLLFSPEDTAALDRDCDDLPNRLAEAARTALAARDLPQIAPVLVGFGQGIDLGLAAASAQPESFKGLSTLGHWTTACAPDPTTLNKAPLRWHDVGPSDRFAHLPGTKPYADTPDRAHALLEAYLGLAGSDFEFVRTETTASLSDLPLIVHGLPDGVAPTGTYAIFLSGDGGWAKFDQRVADRLAAQGIPVVGISSLKYLWAAKTPEGIAADLARIDTVYGPQFGPRVILIGFSLGANVLPFAAAQMPPALAARTAGVVLLSPEAHTGFEIRIGGWLGQRSGTHDVTAAIAATSLPLYCLYGETDSSSACPQATGPALTQVAFDGGHHLDSAYDEIVDIITPLVARPGP